MINFKGSNQFLVLTPFEFRKEVGRQAAGSYLEPQTTGGWFDPTSGQGSTPHLGFTGWFNPRYLLDSLNK